jgi:hypothetical protein
MGIGGKCKDNINMADFEEYVALNDLMIYGWTFSRSILKVSLLILI